MRLRLTNQFTIVDTHQPSENALAAKCGIQHLLVGRGVESEGVVVAVVVAAGTALRVDDAQPLISRALVAGNEFLIVVVAFIRAQDQVERVGLIKELAEDGGAERRASTID